MKSVCVGGGHRCVNSSDGGVVATQDFLSFSSTKHGRRAQTTQRDHRTNLNALTESMVNEGPFDIRASHLSSEIHTQSKKEEERRVMASRARRIGLRTVFHFTQSGLSEVNSFLTICETREGEKV